LASRSIAQAELPPGQRDRDAIDLFDRAWRAQPSPAARRGGTGQARKPEQLADLELKYKSQVHRMALDDAEVFFNTEDIFRERGETASRRFH